MTKIRLMIVDDHEVVRLGMRAAFELESDIHIVGEATNGAEAVAKISVLDPQVILMDVQMEKMDGIEACRDIKSRYPHIHVLMITSFTNEDAVLASIMAAQQVMARMTTGTMSTPGEDLTEREREVLAVVPRGYTNKQIADALHVSEKTARNHVSHILEKLGLSRRSEAAAYAVEYKLVPPQKHPHNGSHDL